MYVSFSTGLYSGEHFCCFTELPLYRMNWSGLRGTTYTIRAIIGTMVVFEIHWNSVEFGCGRYTTTTNNAISSKTLKDLESFLKPNICVYAFYMGLFLGCLFLTVIQYSLIHQRRKAFVIFRTICYSIVIWLFFKTRIPECTVQKK